MVHGSNKDDDKFGPLDVFRASAFDEDSELGILRARIGDLEAFNRWRKDILPLGETLNGAPQTPPTATWLLYGDAGDLYALAPSGTTYTLTGALGKTIGVSTFDYVVDANYSGSDEDVRTTIGGSTFLMFTTVQAAITYGDGVGGNFSIYVAKGTYAETITFASSLGSVVVTLVGAGQNSTIIGPTGAGDDDGLVNEDASIVLYVSNLKLRANTNDYSAASTVRGEVHFDHVSFEDPVRLNNDDGSYISCWFGGGYWTTVNVAPVDIMFTDCHFVSDMTWAIQFEKHFFINCRWDTGVEVLIICATTDVYFVGNNFGMGHLASGKFKFRYERPTGLMDMTFVGNVFPSPDGANGMFYIVGCKAGSVLKLTGNTFRQQGTETNPHIKSDTTDLQVIAQGNRYRINTGTAFPIFKGSFSNSSFGPDHPPDFDIDIDAGSGNIYYGTKATLTGAVGTVKSTITTHDHDGSPTPKLAAANTHESPSASTHHTKYLDSEVDAIVLTHKNVAAAHHTKYLDSEVDTIVATHTGVAAAHHTKYTDGEVDAIVLTHKNLGDAHHAAAHTVASHSDTTATGAELETLTDGSSGVTLHTHAADTAAHTIASHSDTTATGAELETLTSAGDADALHTHPAHAAAGDPHTGYRLESADHSHLTTGAQAGKLTAAATHESPSASTHHTKYTDASALAAGIDDATSDPLIDVDAAADGTEESLARKDHQHPKHHSNANDHAAAHTAASHSDQGATGAELETLTDGSETTLHSHAGGGAHTIASHSDTTATGAELETLTSAGDADALHTHPAHAAAGDPHTGYRLESADHSHATAGAQAGKLDHGTALNGLGDDDHTQYRLESADHSHATAGAQAGKISHDSALNDVSADDHHAQAHTAASHSDQGATGAELETLTDGSETTLHSHAGGGAHTIASHSDTTATGAELETLTDGSDADALHDHSNHGVTHNAAHTVASHSDTSATGAELNTLTGAGDADALHTHPAHAAAGDPHTGYRLESADHSHATTGAQAGKLNASATHESPSATTHHSNANDHASGSDANDHAASHTAASHNDQAATGAELETLTDGSDADTLHDHTTHGVSHALHTEDHDHDGSPTQKILAANSHESPSATTHHSNANDHASGSDDEANASTTVRGVVELATAAESLAGTADRVLSLPNLADSIQTNDWAYALQVDLISNHFRIPLVPSCTGYVQGMIVSVRTIQANTGNVTVDVNLLGSKALLRNGEQIWPGGIRSGDMLTMIYDGTFFQLLTPTYWEAIAANPPRVRCRNNANQTMTTSVSLAVLYNTESYDTDSMHSTSSNKSRLTAKTAGVYDIFGTFQIQSNATGRRQIQYKVNGSTIIGINEISNSNPLSATRTFLNMTYEFAINDYVECFAFQNSGGNLNMEQGSDYTPVFGMTWTGPPG